MNNKIFGKYEIMEEIGRGGMGVVYRARHREIGKVVALKLLQTSGPVREPQVRMFKREIESMAKLNHPNLIGIHDVGEAGGRYYFTMDYIDGCSLDDLMTVMGEAQKQGSSSIREIVEYVQHQKSSAPGWSSARYGSEVETVVDEAAGEKTVAPSVVNLGARRLGLFRALNEARAVGIAVKVLRALAHAHERGVLHRDIKPANIMVTKDGEPVLMDFGLARELDSRRSMQFTRSGQVLGTVSYMSPEQAAGRKDEVRERSDVYSAGAVLYEMLTGRPPFVPSGNLVADLRAVIENDPPPVRRTNQSVSQELAVICHKAMEKDAHRRYRTAWAFAEDLQRYVNGEPILARPQGPAYRLWKKILKHKTASLSAAVLCLALLAALIYWFQAARTIRQKEHELAAEKAKSQSRWIMAYENDFDGPTADTAGWFKTRPDLSKMTYRASRGALCLVGAGTLFSRHKVPGNIMLVFDARISGLNEINVKIKVGKTFGGDDLFYRFMWAADITKWKKEGFWNKTAFRASRDFRKERRVPDLHMDPGAWHHFEISYENGVCLGKVDGREYMRVEDIFPLNDVNNCTWGFMSVIDSLLIDNLRVYRQLLPQRMDVTRIIDVLIGQKDYEGALLQVMELARNYNDHEILDKILKKATVLGENVADLDVFGRLLDDKTVTVRLLSKSGTATGMRFMESLFARVLKSGRIEDFNALASVFSEKLLPEARFQFLVYLGMGLKNYQFDKPSAFYFNKALSVRADPFVERYLAQGVVPPAAETRKNQRVVAGGYLPAEFGRCRRVKSFYMDTTEVTQAAYRALAGTNPAHFKGKQDGPETGLPVDRINWYDAIGYCNLKSRAEGLDPCYEISNARDSAFLQKKRYVQTVDGKELVAYRAETVRVRLHDYRVDLSRNGYRLPTADEFEYAFRAGATSLYFWGDSAGSAGRYAWYGRNSKDRTHAAGTLRPNRFGLYDMAGNVWEWCWDGKAGRPFLLGAAYDSPLADLYCVHRTEESVWMRVPSKGFRCVRNAD